MFNPYAVYVNCDGAMDYDSKNSGGVGFVITFPDFVPLEPIPISIGRYVGGNIERLELEALIQAMKETIDEIDDEISYFNQAAMDSKLFNLAIPFVNS